MLHASWGSESSWMWAEFGLAAIGQIELWAEFRLAVICQIELWAEFG